MRLTIDGHTIPAELLALHCTLRFVSQPDGIAKPVLYTDGKRETRPWSLQIEHDEPQDPCGRSA